MRSAIMSLAAAAILLSAADAWAGPIRHRQRQQAARINEGKAGGSLTAREAAVLEREQRAIDHARDDAVADGRVGPGEAHALSRVQNRASRHIHRLKHNGRE